MSKTRDGNHYVAQSKAWTTGVNSLAASATATSSTKTLKESYDVIVIGAGYAGLVAARDVAFAKKDVLLVEGRDRIGGRTFTYDFLGHKVELGGTWVHWAQPHVWSEMSRYGLTDGLAQSKAFSEPGEFSINYNNDENNTALLRDPRSTDAAMQRLVAAYFDVDGFGGRTIFPFPFKKMTNLEAIRKYDNLSTKGRLQQLVGFSREDIALLAVNLTAFGSIPPEEQSFLTTLHYYALADYDYDRLMTMMGRYKIAEGQSTLAANIFGEFTGDAVFNKAVQSVVSSPCKVVVSLRSGEKITAKHVICTVPINCLNDITFNPPLPPPMVKTQHRNWGGKVIVHLDKKIPSWWGLTAAPTPVDCLLVDKHSEHDGTFVVGFSPSDAHRTGGKVVEDPQIFTDKMLKLCVPSTWDAHVTDLIWHDWNSDEFSKGQWAAWSAGQLKELNSLLASANVSRELTLASADWADGWTGFIDGAIAEGRRAARRAVLKLDSPRL